MIDKTLRVVVEVNVALPDGQEFDTAQLCRSVERAIDGDGFWQDLKYLPFSERPKFGKIRVITTEQAAQETRDEAAMAACQ